MNTAERPKTEWLRMLLYGTFTAVLFLYFFSCGKYLWKTPTHRILFAPLLIVGGGLVLIWLMKKLQEKNGYLLQGVILLVSFLIYGIWGMFIRSEPVSDYRVLIEGAHSVLDGSFSTLSFDKTNYFYFYNYQTGYVLYLAGVMKLFGESLTALKIIEIFWMALTNLLVYHIGCRMDSPLTGIAAAGTYTFLVFNIAGSSVINNQHISAFFAVLAIFLLVGRHNVWSRVGVGLSLAVSFILRPSSILFLVGTLGFLLFRWILCRFRDGKQFVSAILCIGLVFFASVFFFDKAVETAGLTPGPVTKGTASHFKFVLGIQDTGLFGTLIESAEKTQVYFDLEKLNFDYEEYNRLCREYVVDRYINDTERTFRYIQKKMEAFTGMPDNQIQYVGAKIHDTRVERFLSVMGYEQYLLLIFAALTGCVLRLMPTTVQREERKKEQMDYLSLFAIVFLLFWGAHIFIETQTRYRYDQYLLLSLFVAPLISCAYERGGEMVKKLRSTS